MKNIFVLLVLLFVTINSAELRANESRKRQQILKIIDEELRELTRLNRQIGAKNPSLLLRMAELYLEKARHVKEVENGKFLRLDPSQRQRVNKKSFFRESEQYFIQAQKTCYYILKRFKNFKEKGDVYYVLAFNAKEFQQEKKAKTFFARAIKSSSRNSKVAQKSKLALADLHYNNREYSRAIPLYESSLKDRDQTWWTKSAFNLAWCYFREGRKENAVKLMSQIHRLSKNSKYVDMSDLVERDLAYFFSEMGRTNEAISFYKESGRNISQSLLAVGRQLKDQGKGTSAEKVLNEARKYTKSDNDKALIDLELLSLYEKYGKIKKHLLTSKSIYAFHHKSPLSGKNLEDLRYHVGLMSAKLQKQVASRVYRSQKKKRLRMAAYATEYFKISAGLNAKERYKIIFHTAETQYSIGKYNEAIKNYDISFNTAKSIGDNKIASLALNGIMASLGQKGITKKTNDEYLVKAYRLYLSKYPKNKKSFKVYQRLFNSYMEKKDIAKAEETLKQFQYNFPKSYLKAEAMLAQIMDYYREKNNAEGIQKWVKAIKSGDIKVSKAYLDKLQALTLSMQFEDVQKYNTTGEKVKALKGYIAIYNSNNSSEAAKRNSAYNIAVLYFELGKKDGTKKWLNIAIDRMRARDIMKFESSFLLMISGLFNQREFLESAELFQKVLDKVCKSSSKNKEIYFKNANILYLVEGKTDKSEDLINTSPQCGISSVVLREARLDMLKSYADSNRWNKFDSYSRKLSSDTRAFPELIHLMGRYVNALRSVGRIDIALSNGRRILKMYNQSKKSRLKIPIESLDTVAEFELAKLEKIKDQLLDIKLQFPEKKYNNLLKKKFVYLDKLISKALQIFKIGSGIGIVESYKILVESHREVARQIADFKPSGKSADYVKSFKGTMRGFSSTLNNKSKDYIREARQKISENDILSEKNYYFLAEKKFSFEPVFIPETSGILMDRGGRR